MGDSGTEELTLGLFVRLPPPSRTDLGGDGDPAEFAFRVEANAEGIAAERCAIWVSPPLHEHAAQFSIVTDVEIHSLAELVDQPRCMHPGVAAPMCAGEARRHKHRFSGQTSRRADADIPIS